MLSGTTDTLSAQLQQRTTDWHTVGSQLEQTAARLEAIEKSRSWRWSAPVRWLLARLPWS
jgi:hypothetical protein